MPKVTFLTRPGCPGSPPMLENLQAALAARGITDEPEILDIGELPPSDLRTGYGTPTVLVGGSDLFGRHQPTPLPPM